MQKPIHLSYEEIILLTEVTGLGISRIQSIIRNKLNFNELTLLKPYQWSFLKGISPDRVYQDFHKKINDKELLKRIEKTVSNSDKLVFYWDSDYPEHLRRVYSPPVYLSCKGNIDLLNQKQISVIGTRKPTSYGVKSCKLFVKHLAQANNIIISGMAKGIDAIAHQTTIENNAHTIAVLGSGIDHIYPSINRNLYFLIEREGGLIISEHLHDAKPDAVNFPLRNRIIAGMAQSVIVIEAGIKSGAVITANIAVDLGKTIYAVPGSIFSPESDGCNMLIQEGAQVLTQYDDFIMQDYEHHRQNNPPLKLMNLNELESKIINELTSGPRHIDQLSNALKTPPSHMLSSLLNLELQSLIIEVNAKIFQLQII